jgi:PAS domain S-box-containing protein
MKAFSFGSLRVRLVLLVLLGALPALGLTFYSGLEDRRAAVYEVRSQVMGIARHASQMQRRYLAGARQTLFTLCQLPQLHHLDAAATAPILNAVLKNSTMFSAFLAARPDGLVFATAPRSTRKINLGDRPYFKRAVKTERFVVGHYLLGRVTGRPVLSLAHPVKDSGGRLQAVLVTGLKLDWLDKFFAGLKLPPDTHLAVIDRFGRVLVHLPEHPGWVGRNIKDLVITRLVLKQGEGVVEAPGFEGQGRLFAFTSLGQNGGVYILIGVSTAKAFAPVIHKTIRNMVVLGLVFLLALLAAWFGGSVLIRRPVYKILEVMSRVSAGEFAARMGPSGSSGEFGLLAQGLDRMIEMLAAREALLKQQSEANYRAIFNAAEDAIFIHDLADGRILDVNRKVEEMFGYLPQEALEVTVDDLGAGFEPYTQTDALKWIQKAVQEGPQVVEWRCRHKDGRLFWTENTLKVADIGGERRLLAVLKDITERKRLEQERTELLTEMEGKNAELERFTYTVSHDLKSPLITIKGFLGRLEKDAAAGDQKRLGHDIERISQAVEKMGRLLEELLELSRIGRLMNPPEDVSLTDLAREAADMVGGQLDQGRIEVTIQPDLPLVHGDRLRLREVLENLVSNAAKFMGGQSAPRIEIGLRNERDGAVFFVKDNGIGIEPQYHAKVFDLFEQLAPGVQGTGIGLALVKRIVEVHGGRIWVESEGEGQGTTFCFTLPAAGEVEPRED